MGETLMKPLITKICLEVPKNNDNVQQSKKV